MERSVSAGQRYEAALVEIAVMHGSIVKSGSAISLLS